MRTSHLVVSLCALVLLAAVPAPAAAAAVAIDGHVIAPPTTNGKRVTVTLVLTARSERAARLQKAVVRIGVPRRTLLTAPAPGAKPGARRTVRVSPLTIRLGDRVRGTTRFTRKARVRLRRQVLPTLTLRGSRLLSRTSMLSNDELQRMIESLGEQLRTLSARVDALAAATTTGFRSLEGRLGATSARTDQLAGSVASLGSLLATLAGRVETLEVAPAPGGADPAVLQGLRDDIDGLLGRVGSLEGVTSGLGVDLGQLNSTVGGLLGSMSDAESRITDLIGVTGALGTQLDAARGVLDQVPGLVAQVTGIDSALTGLTGRVTSTEDLVSRLDSAVGNVRSGLDDLTTLTGSLVTGLDAQRLELQALDTALSGLASNLGAVTADVGLLQGAVSGLDTTVAGLGGDLGALGGQVTRLQVVSDLVCAVPLLIRCPS